MVPNRSLRILQSPHHDQQRRRVTQRDQWHHPDRKKDDGYPKPDSQRRKYIRAPQECEIHEMPESVGHRLRDKGH